MAARSGNRQLNAALYRIAMTQIKRDGPAKAYYRKRRDGGDSHPEALRRVERRVARCVFGHLRADATDSPIPTERAQTNSSRSTEVKHPVVGRSG